MSWVFVASSSDFPLQNLPFGVFSRKTADPCELRGWAQKKLSKKERKKKGKKAKTVKFDDDTPKSIGVRIGDFVLDLRRLAALGFFGKKSSPLAQALSQESLNAFMGLTQAEWSAVRASVTELLSADNDSLQGSTVSASLCHALSLLCSFLTCLRVPAEVSEAPAAAGRGDDHASAGGDWRLH